jgi:predicted nucleic acid-binding protein
MHPRYNPLVSDVFRRGGTGDLQLVTSTITLGEVLVRPYRHANRVLQEEYRDVLLHGGVEMRAIDWPATDKAAALRAEHGINLIDAIQIAVSLGAGCEAFLTNDTMLKRVTELRILVLDELEL